jgi:uncharacterized protein YfaS (alpha-2-macroglobulin family)
MSFRSRAPLAALLALSFLPGPSATASEPPPADRRLVVVDGADFFGEDYETLKEVELEDCKAACLADERCRAFTYNTKAGWCFLKGSYGEQRPFAAAVSGYVADAQAAEDLAARRQAELAFLPGTYADEARTLSARIAALPLPAEPADRLAGQAKAAAGAGKAQRAADLFRQALRRAPEDAALWTGLAAADLAVATPDWRARQRLRVEATGAAYTAFLRLRGEAERARALALLGLALKERNAWRPAIRALRASLALTPDPGLQSLYDSLLAEHGFRITGHRIDSDAASPRICLELSDALPRGRADLADFVQVEAGRGLAVDVEPRQLCVDGVVHGERYRIRVRAGLPASDGEVLPKTADLDLYVRDRSPSVRFLGRAYVLPKGGAAAIPLASVNSHRIEARLYRIGDRGLAATLGDGTFLKQLSAWETQQIEQRTGEALWSGEVEVQSELNREVTTAVPVAELIDALKPGAYVLTARPAELPASESEALATQWFVVSDLGLAALSGSDGLHALVRSLTSAGPVAEVSLRLVARNDEVLGRTVTNAAGYARFEPGLLRGSGGNAPALLVAEGPDGDYAFLDLGQTPFDLTDRGVDGRPPPKALDVFLVSERGVYRPGETVHLTALARDDRARAVAGVPLTLIVKRPDGVEQLRALVPDQGEGGRHVALALLPTAMRGTWRAAIHADPEEPPLAERPFLVEDFEPERLDFGLATAAQVIDPAEPPELRLQARFLYGAPAAGLAVEGELRLQPTDAIPAHPGFRFGLADEESQPNGRPLTPTRTDAGGRAVLPLGLPESPSLTRPLEARVKVRVLDGGGRPVERDLTLPVASEQARIGIKPLFEGSVEEGGNAAFEVLALGPGGGPLGQVGLAWTLSRVRTAFQWYQVDGRWDYEPVVDRERVASGRVEPDEDGIARVEAKVDWGGYELRVEGEDGAAIPASLAFEAGWYLAPKAVDTPDLLKVSLDKPEYRVGETARVHVEPRFPGLALVLVVDDRLVSMTPVEVPAEGATVELPVTAEWGPGAYVTAVLYRPMDLAARRMPARALGLAWAGVDPADRRLALQVAAPERAAPRAPLELGLTVAGLPAGEAAYVTVAAVDVGILNLTRYATPAPEAWYFGQRRLGMELRDLYGRLIDRMQGVPGAIRSGGDGAQMRFEGPPPTEELVAFHSGILRVDADGGARVAFDLPDFNGTVRVMAMAWTSAGVGHAEREVLVRDPVVIATSLPRFLAPGDASRLLLELTHVEGPAGEVALALEAGDGVLVDPAAVPERLTLAEGARKRVEVPLAAVTIGDHPLLVRLTTPDGRALTKRLTVPVRANRPPIARTSATTLAPGGAGLAVSLDMLDDLVPGTGAVLVSATGAGRLDVAGLLAALDRYPYGCAEQLTSRALPLLYLDDVALAVGLDGDREVPERVRETIADLLGKQDSGGGFGLWGPGGGDLWLDAYITDFLTRAQEEGYPVPDTAFALAVENLRNRLAYAPDFETGGEDLAYALYVLARNARAVIGDLRYYAEARLESFATPLARAQLGAALALYGDRPRSDTAFRSALTHLERAREPRDAWRPDYGSTLRDAAAILALAAESGTTAIDLQALAARVQSEWDAGEPTSTQEQVWLLLAAHALMRGANRPGLALDGQTVEGPFYRRFAGEVLAAAPVVLANRGERPVEALVTVTGVPLTPPPAGGAGYRIERAYYDLEGRRVDPARVAQGARLVAVVSVTAEAKRAARLIINDPLPAGFEVDNPNLIRAGDVADIPWLGLEETVTHKEVRADRFVAALERSAEDRPDFQLAYLVRAVSPGRFAHPAATVEDMYRPRLRAWTGAGAVEVVAGPR